MMETCNFNLLSNVKIVYRDREDSFMILLFWGGVLDKAPGGHQLLDHGLGVLGRHDGLCALPLKRLGAKIILVMFEAMVSYEQQ